MSAPGGTPAESVLARAAGIDDVLATMGTLAPMADVYRGLRLLEAFPGDPDRLEDTGRGYLRAADDAERSADDLDRQLRTLLGPWRGAAADAATGTTGDSLERLRRDAAGGREVGSALLVLADALRPERDAHARIVDRVAAMQAVTAGAGPLSGPTGATEAAAEALREGAALLRRVHEHDQTAARRVRAVLGDVAGPVPGPNAAPVDGGRILGLDAPAPGQSGVQMAGPVAVVTLNAADTQRLVDTLEYAAPTTTAVGAVAGAFTAGAAAPIAVVGAQGMLANVLIGDHRTPSGVRLYMVGTQVVAATGR